MHKLITRKLNLLEISNLSFHAMLSAKRVDDVPTNFQGELARLGGGLLALSPRVRLKWHALGSPHTNLSMLL